jgi:ankyrin repeat domain-containing protein 50
VLISWHRSIVLEHITTKHGLDDKVGVAFAYFKDDSPESQEPSRVVSTFIKQLCWKKEQIPRHLLDFYHTYDRDVRIPAFDKYKDNFFRLAKSFDQTFIVIDALDECKQDEQNGIQNREQIMDFIFHLADDMPCAKFFVTSRRETDITDAFARHQTPTIRIEAKNVTGDINTYVNDRVENLLKAKKLRLGKATLKGKIVELLVAKAEGM